MERKITIGLEEYKALLEDHILLQNAERKLQKKRKAKSNLFYVEEVADMLGLEWEDDDNEAV